VAKAWKSQIAGKGKEKGAAPAKENSPCGIKHFCVLGRSVHFVAYIQPIGVWVKKKYNIWNLSLA